MEAGQDVDVQRASRVQDLALLPRKTDVFPEK